jgi:hypothetical protein
VIRRTLRERQIAWDRSWENRKTQLEHHLQRCQFDADLHQLSQQLGDLATQLGRVKGQFGESLATARANAQAFVNFERTIEVSSFVSIYFYFLPFCIFFSFWKEELIYL